VRTFVAVIAAAMVAASATADPVTFRVEPALTTARFAVTELGMVSQSGRFERTWGSIVLDPAHGGGSVDFIVDTTSVRTGWDLRDAFLRGERMFDVERFPVIRFRSTHMVYAGAQLVAVDGAVTLRGVTQPVRLAVRGLRCTSVPPYGREECGAVVATTISRAAFGMTYAYPLVGDEIDLTVLITALRVRDGGETGTP